MDSLINHGLQALSASLQEGDLTTKNCTVGVVGKDMRFTIISGEALQPYLSALKEENIGDFLAIMLAAGLHNVCLKWEIVSPLKTGYPEIMKAQVLSCELSLEDLFWVKDRTLIGRSFIAFPDHR